MSASWPGRMRGPGLKTPLLLLLLLLTSLTGSVFCQDGEEGNTDPEVDPPEEEADAETGGDGDTTTAVIDTTPAPDPSDPENTDSDQGIEETDSPGSGDEGKIGRSFEYHETTPSSTMHPDGVTYEPREDPGLSLIIILVPVVLVILFIAMIVCGFFVSRRWKQKTRTHELVKDDPYLDGSSTEKVPMPMFEEDVPSVLELEMEELDQWMKKDSVTVDDCNHA